MVLAITIVVGVLMLLCIVAGWICDEHPEYLDENWPSEKEIQDKKNNEKT